MIKDLVQKYRQWEGGKMTRVKNGGDKNQEIKEMTGR